MVVCSLCATVDAAPIAKIAAPAALEYAHCFANPMINNSSKGSRFDHVDQTLPTHTNMQHCKLRLTHFLEFETTETTTLPF